MPTITKLLKQHVYYDFNGKSPIKNASIKDITINQILEAGKNVLIVGPQQTISKFNKKERNSHDVQKIVNKEIEELKNKQSSSKAEFHKITPIDTASKKISLI